MFRRAAAVLALGGLAGLSLAQTINYTFDAGVQGWTKGNLGSTFATIDPDSNGPATWDAVTQSILGNDHSSYAYHFSPDLGGGYGGLFGQELSFDYRSLGNGGNDPFVVLVSSADFLVLPRTITATPNLVNYSFTLDDSEGFYFNSSPYYNGANAVLATNAQVQAVLADLRYIGVSTDITGGGDTTYLDNLNAVPEPFTLGILGAAGLAIAARRRRSRA